MTKSSTRTLLAVAIALAAISGASAAPPTKTGTTAKGSALTDANGKSLYTFDSDAARPVNMRGECATNWPPVWSPPMPRLEGGRMEHREPDDGTRMWAYEGKPLYTFTKDKKPGDVIGEGVKGGVWHLAQP